MTQQLIGFGESIDSLVKTALRIKAERDALLGAAIEAVDLISSYVDVVDGDYGVPAPNAAMLACTLLTDAIARVEIKDA